MKQPLTASPSARLSGRVRVPGDKSISHRALMFGALATGRPGSRGLLEAEDVLNTAKALQALGADRAVDGDGGGDRAAASAACAQPARALDFGNSGTGSAADAGRRRRPRHARAHHRRRLAVAAADGPRARRRWQPWALRGRTRPRRAAADACAAPRDLLPIDYDLPVPSAQVKSAVLLAGLHAPGDTTVIEPQADAATTPSACCAISAPR